MFGIVLENDENWFFLLQNAFITGLFQGVGRSNNGTYTAGNQRLTDFSTFADVGFSASYRVNSTFNGTAFLGSSPLTFTLNYLSAYDSPATQAAATGTWTAQLGPGLTGTLSIQGSGAFLGSTSAGCNLSGTLTPRAGGKNVYVAVLTLGPAPCGAPGQTMVGIGLIGTGPDQRTQLTLATLNSTRTDWFVAVWNK
jgi:hypothetical protein